MGRAEKYLYSSVIPLILSEDHLHSPISSQTHSSKASNMISNILSVATLAGVAMAACPLSIKIAGTTDHVAQVAVTNTGSEAVTVFKGNTVFSEHATKDLVVAKEGTFTSSNCHDFPKITTNDTRRWYRTPVRGCLCQLQALRSCS